MVIKQSRWDYVCLWKYLAVANADDKWSISWPSDWLDTNNLNFVLMLHVACRIPECPTTQKKNIFLKVGGKNEWPEYGGVFVLSSNQSVLGGSSILKNKTRFIVGHQRVEVKTKKVKYTHLYKQNVYQKRI